MKEYPMKNYEHFMLANLKSYDFKDSEVMLFNVANNFEGRTFIAMLRKALNKKGYSIRVRGSQSDRLSYKAAGISLGDQSVPLKYADRLRVYIEGVSQPKISASQATVIADLKVQLSDMKYDLEESQGEVANLDGNVDSLRHEVEATRKQKNELAAQLFDKTHHAEELAAEVAELTEELRVAKLYEGADDEQKRFLNSYRDAHVVKMGKAFYTGDNKIQVLKAVKESASLTFKDAKTLCDFIIFKNYKP